MRPACDALPVPPSALCGGCNYPLRGLAEPRCPECGRGFDPNDPRTMNLGRPTTALARWALAPPGRPLAGLALFAAAFTLAATSVPGSYVLVLLSAVLLWCVCGAWWLLRVLTAVVVDLIYRRRAQRSAGGLWRWGVAPALVALTVAAVKLGLPARAAYRLSRPAMDRLAARTMAAPPGTRWPGRQWVGVFPARDVERTAAGVKFTIVGAGFMGIGGFEYSAGAAPASVGELSYRPAGGGWYSWVENW